MGEMKDFKVNKKNLDEETSEDMISENENNSENEWPVNGEEE